jgi:electron transfer flavoprotein beta subunit
MSYHSIVLVKQVPDTANISGDVMKPDGTVNRAKLPAVFNPEDKVALEMALQLKERYGGKVTAITMGPPKASDLLRECLFMGADEVCLITDRKFAGADTLATSYVLSETLKKFAPYDFIFAGRQAIDGDTAQVGPQTAEKLGIPQVTYAEEILEVKKDSVIIKRRIDGGNETLKSVMPVLITVIKEAAEPRPFRAKLAMAYKNAKSMLEIEKMVDANSLLILDDLVEEYKAGGVFIPTLTTEDLDVDVERCGISGSPTKVHKIESVVLAGGEHENISPDSEGLGSLVDKLMEDHIFG